MMAFLILILLGAGALLIAWSCGLRGTSLTLAASAMLFGGVGYALQGTPYLNGSPRAAAEQPKPAPLAGARQAMTGQFDYADQWLNMADALESRGRTEDAARLLARQVREYPNEYKLWLGLGNALSDHARTLSPAARLAFERSIELAPNQPAPRFFLGLAEARSGNPSEALRLWEEILADAPATASWRPIVEDGVAMIKASGPVGQPKNR